MNALIREIWRPLFLYLTRMSQLIWDVVINMNGMHRFSGVHKGIDAWMEILSPVPGLFDDFSVTPTNMIAEGDQVFTQIHAKAKGLDAIFGHYHKLVDGKIKEF